MEYDLKMSREHSVIYDEIKSIINNAEQKVEKYKEQEKKEKMDGKNKVNFFRKIVEGKPASKIWVDKLIDYREIDKLLFEIWNYNSDNYKISDKLKENLNQVAKYLSQEELNKFTSKINGDIYKKDSIKKDKFYKKCEEFEKKLRETNLYNNSIFSVKYREYNNSTIMTVFNNLKADILNKNQNDRYYFTDKDKMDRDYSDSYIKEVESLINSKYFDVKIEGNKKIKDNFSQIKNVYIEKNKINDILLSITNCVVALQKENQVDFSDVIVFLKEIENKNIKLLKEKEEYLKKFDLQSLNKLIEYKREEDNKKDIKSSGMENYQQIYYKLLEIQEKDPDNYEMIRELESQLRDCVRNFGLQDNDLFNAQINARDKYSNDQMTKWAERANRKEEQQAKEQRKADAYNRLRELAIAELQLSGSLDSISPTIKNGDISNAAEIREKEDMIARKMEEIAKISEMSPQERLVEELIKSDRLPKGATVNDLHGQQRMDANYAYRDSSYAFVKEYKNNVVGDVKINLFGEYVKYKASLVDKSKGLSFSEFIKKNYSLSNDQEISLEEEQSSGRRR